MLTVKCSDADSTYKKIRQYLIKGDITQAEKLISVLEQMNSVTLKDLQSEMSCNADLFDLIAFLGETI